MDNILIKRLFGVSDASSDPSLKYCALIQQSQSYMGLDYPDIDKGTPGTLQLLMVSKMKDLMLEGGSIALAFLAVAIFGVVMFYMVNGIYVLSYIMIQLLVGDGKSSHTDNKNLIHQLIYDQILLHRFWKKSSVKINKSPPSSKCSSDAIKERQRSLNEKANLLNSLRTRKQS